MYPLSLIHRRKGSRLHVGSNPTVPTKKYKNNENYLKLFGSFKNFCYICIIVL